MGGEVALVDDGGGAVTVIGDLGNTRVRRFLVGTVVTHILKQAGNDLRTNGAVANVGRVDRGNVHHRAAVVARFVDGHLKVNAVLCFDFLILVVGGLVDHHAVAVGVRQAVVGDGAGIPVLYGAKTARGTVDHHILEADVRGITGRDRGVAVCRTAGQHVTDRDVIIIARSEGNDDCSVIFFCGRAIFFFAHIAEDGEFALCFAVQVKRVAEEGGVGIHKVVYHTRASHHAQLVVPQLFKHVDLATALVFRANL